MESGAGAGAKRRVGLQSCAGSGGRFIGARIRQRLLEASLYTILILPLQRCLQLQPRTTDLGLPLLSTCRNHVELASTVHTILRVRITYITDYYVQLYSQ